MRRRLAALAVVAPLVAGCSATLRTSAVTRLEHAQSELAPASTSVRIAPVVTLSTSQRADAPSLELAPQLNTGATSGSRLRARLRWTGHEAWHPSLAASFEQGQTRTSELAADTLTPLPSTASISSQQLHATADLRRDYGRRTQLTAAIDGAHSAGVGASASTLPSLTATHVTLGLQWMATRHLQTATTLSSGSERVGQASALAITRLTSAMHWNFSRTVGLNATAGVVAAGSGAAPSIEFGIGRGRLPSEFRASASVARGPEVDRLSGELTQRLRTRVRIETPLVPHVSFGGTLQQAADQGGALQRVVRSGDAAFAIDLGRSRRVEIGVARFQQYTGAVTTNAETRAFLQLTLAPTR